MTVIASMITGSGWGDWTPALVSFGGMLILIAVCVFAVVAPRDWVQTARRSVLPIGAALLVLPNVYFRALGLSDYEPFKAFWLTLVLMCGPALVVRAAWRRRRSADRVAATMSTLGAPATPVHDSASQWVGRRFAAMLAKSGLGWPALLALTFVVIQGIAIVVPMVQLTMIEGWSRGMASVALGFALVLGIMVAVIFMVALGPLNQVRQIGAGAVRAATSDAPAQLVESLNRVSLAAGVTPPALRVLEQGGVNALVLPAPGREPEILVTRGAIDSLPDSALEVILANLLARLSAGVASASAVSDDVTADIGPADLAEINASADAATLLILRDPERVLEAMHAIALRRHRVVLPAPVSPACFYCWPHQPPPHDMPDRVKQTVSRAGTAGHMWWKGLQERRRQAATESA